MTFGHESRSSRPSEESRSSEEVLQAGAVKVCVCIQKAVPLAVIERGPWAEPPLVLFRENGEVEVQAVTYDLDAAAQWVLERGAGAEVMVPPPLRRRVATQAWKIYRRYRSDDVRLPGKLG